MEAMSILNIVLPEVKKAADAFINGVESEVPKFSDDELNVLENLVAAQFHVPANIVSFLKGENANIEKVVDPLAVTALEFLKARIDGLAL